MWGSGCRVGVAPRTQLGTSLTGSLGQGRTIHLSVCPGAPICLLIPVPGVKPSSQQTLHRLKGFGVGRGERCPDWAVAAVFPYSLSLEGCFAPANSQNSFYVNSLYVNSLDLKPRENRLGVTAGKSPLFSALSPWFWGAEALGLQELLWKAGWKLSNLGSSGWTTILSCAQQTSPAQGKVRVVFLFVGVTHCFLQVGSWEEAS